MNKKTLIATLLNCYIVAHAKRGRFIGIAMKQYSNLKDTLNTSFHFIFPRNFLLSIRQNRGFTLAELLAVTGILVIVSTVVAGIIVYTLRGSSKARVTNAVSQNGNAALSVMSNNISNSKNFIGVQSGATFTNVCSPGGTASTKVRVLRWDDQIQEYECNLTDKKIYSKVYDSSGSTLLSTSQLLEENEVELRSCSIVCYQDAGDYTSPRVKVTVGIANVSSQQTVERLSSTQLETVINIRNYNR